MNSSIFVADAESGGDRERADVVAQAGRLRGDEVGERTVRHAGAVLGLLAQLVQGRQHLGASLVGVDLDVVVVDGVGREQPEDAGGAQPLLLDERVEHALRVVPELAGRLPDAGLLRMSGNLPFISQALKNGCQSM